MSQNEPMTRLQFASVAARIAERASDWAATTTQWPGPEKQGEPISREAALRFCVAIEGLLGMIREEANG
jgi:hypothetical protein